MSQTDLNYKTTVPGYQLILECFDKLLRNNAVKEHLKSELNIIIEDEDSPHHKKGIKNNNTDVHNNIEAITVIQLKKLMTDICKMELDKSFSNYMTEFKIGNYTYFEKHPTLTSSFFSFLDYNDEDEFKIKSKTIDPKRVKLIKKLTKIKTPEPYYTYKPGYFLSQESRMDLEFNEKYEHANIYIITDSLEWARYNLHRHFDQIKQHDKRFRIILTSDKNIQNIQYFDKVLEEREDLREHIKILKLYEQEHYKKVICTNKMIIPMLYDTVIYEVKEQHSNEYEYAGCMIAPLADKNPPVTYVRIKVDDDEGKDIRDWFKEVWELNDPKKQKAH